MAEGRLSDRVSALEAQMESMKEFRTEMKGAVAELRDEVGQMKQTFSLGLGEVKDQLRDVVIGSLNSMPPWGAKLLIFGGVVVGALATLAGALFAAHGARL